MGIIIDCVSLMHIPTLWRILLFFPLSLYFTSSHRLCTQNSLWKSLSLELLCGDLFVFSLHKAANIQTLGPVPKSDFISFTHERTNGSQNFSHTCQTCTVYSFFTHHVFLYCYCFNPTDN